ncbi:MAG TPA: response regulator transcription factor [Tepidisphaeraceae bacterium]|nr:response regulator transcription factor [Tepidisphaeraceae bacterium]
MSDVKILIADDHQIVRQGLRSMLAGHPGFDVIAETDNGRSAVRLARDLNPDVTIMDITMPDLNGVEATRQIHADNPDARVIGLSMHAERQFVMEMLGASAKGYLLKNGPFDELVAAIEAAVAGEIYVSPKVTGVLVKECIGDLPRPGTFCGTLSSREREVLQLVAEGKSTKEIAFTLRLSGKTVEAHRRQVMEKLKLYSVAELTRYAIREGMTSLV